MNFTTPSNTTASTDGGFCVSRKQPSFIAFTAIPSIPIVINVGVLIAITMNNRNLRRQSRVYAHVSSTILANVIFSFLALMQIVSLYFNLEGYAIDSAHKGKVREELVKLWAFRKSFLYGMYIIMCGNIGFLVEVIRSRINISLRSAAGAVRINDKKPYSRSYRSSVRDTAVPSSRVARRRRSYLAICSLWILSLIYVITPIMGWSCADVCSCLSSCFPEDEITHPPVSGCSRAFPPLSNSWIAVTIGMWAVGLTAVLIHLKRSISSLRKAYLEHIPRKASVSTNTPLCENLPSQPDSPNIELNTAPLVSQASSEEKKSAQQDEKCDNSDDLKADKKTSRWSIKNFLSRSRSSQKRFHERSFIRPQEQFKHVILLTVTFALCTAPPMMYLVADMALPRMEMNMMLMNVCLLFPFIYCVISPVLLIRCLPGLQKSMRKLVLSICRCSSSPKSRRQTSVSHTD